MVDGILVLHVEIVGCFPVYKNSLPDGRGGQDRREVGYFYISDRAVGGAGYHA